MRLEIFLRSVLPLEKAIAAKLRDSVQRGANGIGHNYPVCATMCKAVKSRAKFPSSIRNLQDYWQDAFAKVSESLRFGQIFDKLLGVLA